MGHILQINADRYTPVDESLIPTGIATVEGTAFDFRRPKKIGDNINDDEEQIRIGGGYDHNFVLVREDEGLTLAATAIGDKTGIRMETFTTEPGVQLFSANFPQEVLPDSYRTSFCLETQHYPDSPNQPSFPSTIVQKGQEFSSKTIYKFSK